MCYKHDILSSLTLNLVTLFRASQLISTLKFVAQLILCFCRALCPILSHPTKDLKTNKLKSLKVAQLKDDDGGGVVNASMNGCVSDGVNNVGHDVVCDIVCDFVCDVVCDVLCGGVGDGR